MKEQHRVVIYIPKPDYQQLRIKLLEQGKTASQWFREKVAQFLKTH